MKLQPLADRVVLKQLEAEETTKSGIVLPGKEKEKPQQAEVVAVGPGGMVDGKEIAMCVKVGDKVKKGDVIMIIESMKLMNEIQSDYDGIVDRILVSDGQAVEFDQPIMVIK